MTNLEYLRMRIPDKDPAEKILTDDELKEIIRQNSEVIVVQAQRRDREGYVYQIPFKRVDEDYRERVWINGIEQLEFAYNKETGEITFKTPLNYATVEIQIKRISWGDVLADVYEIIMGDFRKLTSFSVQNATQSMDDIKAHLRYLARYYRSPTGWDL